MPGCSEVAEECLRLQGDREGAGAGRYKVTAPLTSTSDPVVHPTPPSPTLWVKDWIVAAAPAEASIVLGGILRPFDPPPHPDNGTGSAPGARL